VVGEDVGQFSGVLSVLLVCLYLEGQQPSEPGFPARRHWFPFNVPGWLHARAVRLRRHPPESRTAFGTLTIDLAQPDFITRWLHIGDLAFGLRRIRRRNTPYVRLKRTR